MCLGVQRALSRRPYACTTSLRLSTTRPGFSKRWQTHFQGGPRPFKLRQIPFPKRFTLVISSKIWTRRHPGVALRRPGAQLSLKTRAQSSALPTKPNATLESPRNSLAQTEPTRMENRTQFVARLRLAVAWLNRRHASYLQHLCASQKERARDVIDAEGGRTKH